MPRRARLSALLAVLTLAALPAVASAGWFPAQPVDGPSGDVERLGGVDLARDGKGALVYLKRVAGVPHVFLSRFDSGQFRPPERVDNGIGEGASEAAVAVADGGRIAVAWASGGRLYGSAVAGGRGAPGPLLGPTALYADPGGTVSDLSLDMGINGTAYATFATTGGGGSDVRAARLVDTSWEGVGPSLDIDPAQAAGRGAQHARVAVSADGNALVVWGENHTDGRPRVYARRVIGLAPSAFPQEISLPELLGRLGGPADSADVDVEDDGSFAWAVFRQDFGGGSRSVARRLLGSQFESPAPLDNGAPTGSPRIAINGRGEGLAAIEYAGGGVLGSVLDADVFQPGAQLSSQPSTQGAEPKPAASEHRERALAWRVADGAGNGSVRGRFKAGDEPPFEGEVELSRGDLGPVGAGQFAIGADRLGGFAVAMVQGAPGGRTVTAAVYDNPPARPGPITHGGWVSIRELRWRPGTDLWGPKRFRAMLNGRAVGETTGSSLRPSSGRVRDGRRVTFQVVGIDSRGQESPSEVRRARADSTAPRLSVKVSGGRRRGAAVRVTATARERRRNSGVSRIRVRYGDSRRVVGRRGGHFRAAHTYRRRGRFTLRVTAFDRAGNTRIKTVRLRIS